MLIRINQNFNPYALLFKSFLDFTAWRDNLLVRSSNDPRFFSVALRADAVGQIYNVDEFVVKKSPLATVHQLNNLVIHTEYAVRHLSIPTSYTAYDADTGTPYARPYSVWAIHSDYYDHV